MRQTTSLAQRFDAKVDRTGGPTACHLWLGSLRDTGYGQIAGHDGHRPMKAHRVAWELAHGRAVPTGMCVLHSCHERRCVNPRHLRLGTNADNVRDMITAGRHSPGKARGEEFTSAKLTKCDVRHLRQSSDTTAALARRFHVSESLVRRVRQHRAWKHVG